jgi:hypothetical protein
MSGFGEDDSSPEEVVARGTVGQAAQEALDHRASRSKRGLTMFDTIRATMYSTMSGMIEAGIGMAEAAEMLSREYAGEGMEDAAASVSIFFGETVSALSTGGGMAVADRIGDAALRAFGTKFVGAEEMALLKALSVTSKPEKILLACARLLAQYRGEYSAGAVSSFRRFAG